MDNIAFWCTAYKEKVALFNMVKQVREFHDEPFHIISDNGDDFSGIAKKFNCHYTHRTTRIGNHSGGPNKVATGTIMDYFESLRDSILNELRGVRWIVYMEPDVEIFRPITDFPKFPLAGGPRGPHLSVPVCDYLKKKHPQCVGKAGFAVRMTGSGGSIIHAQTFIKVLQSTSPEEWEDLLQLEPRGRQTGDLGMTILFQNQGHITGGWVGRDYSCLKDGEDYESYRRAMALKCTIAHAQKKFYRESWTSEYEEQLC